MIFVFILSASIIQPSLTADVLNPRKFSQTLSKLATDGLGTNTLQVSIEKHSFIYS